MKIGDEVYDHGYIDEIRSDTIIIRNEGGYFGTIPEEVNCSEKPNNCDDVYPCDTCKHNKLEWFSEVCDGCCGAHSNYEPKTEPQKCYLRESCDHYGDKQACGRCREYNLYSHTKTEPQTDYRITGTIGYRCPKCGRGNFLKNESNCVYCGEPLIKDEPQTDCAWGKGE